MHAQTRWHTNARRFNTAKITKWRSAPSHLERNGSILIPYVLLLLFWFLHLLNIFQQRMTLRPTNSTRKTQNLEDPSSPPPPSLLSFSTDFIAYVLSTIFFFLRSMPFSMRHLPPHVPSSHGDSRSLSMPCWMSHYHPLLLFAVGQRSPIQSSTSFEEWFLSTLVDFYVYFHLTQIAGVVWCFVRWVTSLRRIDSLLVNVHRFSLQIRFMTSLFHRGCLNFHVPSPRADWRCRSLLCHTVGEKPMLQSPKFSLLDHVRHRW